jgi:hypothetical protein
VWIVFWIGQDAHGGAGRREAHEKRIPPQFAEAVMPAEVRPNFSKK